MPADRRAARRARAGASRAGSPRVAARTTLRQARPDDMLGCARVFVRSSADLARRQGLAIPPSRARDMARALGHVRGTDPRGFHVAVRNGRVVAFACTLLRGNTHFLSMFWALPALQSQGVGRRLLARAFEHPRPPAGAVRCVFASLDTRAQMLYLKFGMRPRGMFYVLNGTPRRTAAPRQAVDLVPVGEPGTVSRRMLAIAARYDRTFRGARRDADLRYVLALPGARFFVARARGRDVGYAIVTASGRVGPAGVVAARHGAAFAWAIADTARRMGAKQLTVIVPGVNDAALETFLRAGLRTVFFGAWMSAAPVGAFENYLLAGGMLL